MESNENVGWLITITVCAVVGMIVGAAAGTILFPTLMNQLENAEGKTVNTDSDGI